MTTLGCSSTSFLNMPAILFQKAKGDDKLALQTMIPAWVGRLKFHPDKPERIEISYVIDCRVDPTF